MMGFPLRKASLTLFAGAIIFSLSVPCFAGEYSLYDLWGIALERSERIRIAAEELDIAEAAKDKAASTLMPRVSAFGSYTRYNEDKRSSSGSVIQPESSEAWGLRLDQSFSLSGREFTALGISRQAGRKAGLDFQAAKETYIIGVTAAYFEVLKAKAALELATTNMERLGRHRDAAKKRFEVGEVTKTVLLRAEAELSGAKTEEIRARNRLELSRAVLARLAGVSGDFSLKEIDVAEEPLGLDAFKEKALAERPELKSLALQKAIAERQVGYARGSYWPSLSIEALYQRREEEPSSAFLNKESVYAGARLDFPIFEGGLRMAEVGEAASRRTQARLAFEEAQKTVLVEVEEAYLELKARKDALESIEDRVSFAKENYTAVSKQFEFGLADTLDAMDANTLLAGAEKEFAEARYDYQFSVLRLRRAVGILLKQE